MNKASSGTIAIQNKVNRFINGHRSPRDLDAIFLWIRGRSYGSAIVKDIGDFVGHAEHKNRGVVWDKASLLSSMFNSALPHISGAKKVNLENYKEGILAVFKSHDAAEIKKITGVGQTTARRILESALPKLSADGARVCGHDLSEDEHRILSHFDGKIIVRPAYSDTELVQAFADCLIKNSFLHSADRPKVMAAKEFIAVYAIEKMHFCHLILGNNLPCVLNATISGDCDRNRLSVSCITTVNANGKTVDVSTTIFDSSCKARDWVDQSLWEPGLSGTWTVPIEMAEDGKLREVV